MWAIVGFVAVVALGGTLLAVLAMTLRNPALAKAEAEAGRLTDRRKKDFEENDRGILITRARSGRPEALWLAAGMGDMDLLDTALGASTDINACDANGWTALHFAASSGQLQVVQRLLECGADAGRWTNDEALPADVATRRGHPELARLLAPTDSNDPRTCTAG